MPSEIVEIRPTIQSVVATKIAACGEKVKDTVIDALVPVEINKRVEVISKALKTLEELEKNFKKINKPDNSFYNAEGAKVETTSSVRYQEIQKCKEKIENLKKVMESALEGNTAEAYTKLTEVLNKSGNAGGDKKESSATAEPVAQ